MTHALDAGRLPEAHAALRDALAETIDLEDLNDLAVLAHELGRPDEAEALLRAVLAIDPARAEAAANLCALDEVRGPDGWRRSATLGGPDPALPERAFPGMPHAAVMGEHCARYAFALGRTGGRHVLDLACGTGYGSEMLSWTAASVRGFDLWVPEPGECPRWPGGAVLTYGHDLCADALPPADVAVMFEVIEHLADAPHALELAFGAADELIASFPNPTYHGSWLNPYHVNDWSLDRFEDEVRRAAGRPVEVEHLHQAVNSPLIAPGRDPEAWYWIVAVRAA